MSYTKTRWQNGQEPAINDENLNKIEQGIYEAHEEKVDKVAGKGLSTNDYSNAEKTKVSDAIRSIKAIWKRLVGQKYMFDVDEEGHISYSENVPSGAYFDTILKYGGKSLVFNQLDNHNATTSTKNGVTFANNADGSWTINGTQNASNTFANTRYIANTYFFVEGHKYYLSAISSLGNNLVYFGQRGNTIVGRLLNEQIVTAPAQSGSYDLLRCRVVDGYRTTISNVKVYPMCIDLTQMFGAGNEPSTVAEVKAMFPNKYYAYNTGEIKSASVDSVDIRGFNLLDTSGEISYIRTGGIDSNLNHKNVLNSDGTITVNVAGADTYGVGFKVMCDAMKEVTFEFDILSLGNGVNITGLVYDADSYTAYLARVQKGSGHCSVSFTPTETKYYYFLLYVGGGTTPCGGKIGNVYVHYGSGTYKVYNPSVNTRMSIPSTIQSLDGYGWSAGNVYNEVDFERKKYIQRLFKTVVDGINIRAQYYGVASSGHQLFFVELGAGGALSEGDLVNLLSNLYPTYPASDTINQPDRTIRYQAANRYRLYWQDDRYTSANAMNTALAQEPLEIISLLATPVEIDISDILETFPVEAGGTVTFHSDDDYHIPINNTNEWIVKIDEV